MCETALSNSCKPRFADHLRDKTHLPSRIPKSTPTTPPAQNITISFLSHILPEKIRYCLHTLLIDSPQIKISIYRMLKFIITSVQFVKGDS